MADGSTRGSAAGVAHATPTAGGRDGRTDDLVRLANVDVFYGPVQALFGVNVRVGAGEVISILGGNASGKSTTLKSVLGIVRPKRGTVYLDGARVDGLSPAEIIRRGAGSIPEGRRVFPEMSVRENLLMGGYVRRREGAERLGRDLEAAIALFPAIGGRLDQAAGTLSGGEQQMLAMARAWMRHPRLLCIDEPSMGLSPRYVDRVYEIIQNLKDQGITILMVEQSAKRALDVADRAYVLQNGSVVVQGAAARLAADPAIRRAYLGESG